jgi:hypothetical protein
VSEKIEHLCIAVAALCVLAWVAPVLIRLLAAALPLVAMCGLVIVVVRLVWHYTEHH